MGKFGHYLVVALRSLKKNRVSSGLSLLGLVAAFSLSIIVGLNTWDGFNSDGHWKNASNIFRLSRTSLMNKGSYGIHPFPNDSIESMKTFSSDIKAVSAPSQNSYSIKLDNGYQNFRLSEVDADFLKIFDFEVISGNLQTVTETPGMIALSDEKAESIFGKKNPIGETIELIKDEKPKLFTVGAVYKRPPSGAVSYLFEAMAMAPESVEANRFAMWRVFLLLDDNADHGLLFDRLNTHLKDKYPPPKSNTEIIINIEPLKGALLMGFMSNYYLERQTGLFISSALMLLVALINYMALTTAAAATRGKDVALRKILGAGRGELSTQYLVESLVIVSLAYLLSLACAEIIADQIGAIIGKTFVVVSVPRIPHLLVGWFIAIVAGFIASAYPIWALVHGKASNLLANFQRSLVGGGTWLRSLLLVIQAAFGLGLVFGAGVVYIQTSTSQSADKGFETEGLLYLTIPYNTKENSPILPMLNAMERIDGVKNTAISQSSPPYRWGIGEMNHAHPATGEKVEIKYAYIGDDFHEALGTPILAGRIPAALERTKKGEEKRSEDGIIVNEALVAEYYDVRTYEEVLGRCLYRIKSDDTKSDTCYRIRAVVANYHQSADDDALVSTIYFPQLLKYSNNLIVRYDPAHEKKVLEDIQKIWEDYFPFKSLDYSFVDDLIEQKFRSQRATASLLLFTALSSLILTVAGLYAMAKFVVARRGREIAIRRVLGASSMDIVKIVVMQLARPIILGGLIGLPIGWYYATDWLSAYSIRIEVAPWHAVLLGIVGVAFFLITATGEILRAVRIRPAVALHYE